MAIFVICNKVSLYLHFDLATDEAADAEKGDVLPRACISHRVSYIACRVVSVRVWRFAFGVVRVHVENACVCLRDDMTIVVETYVGKRAACAQGSHTRPGRTRQCRR